MSRILCLAACGILTLGAMTVVPGCNGDEEPVEEATEETGEAVEDVADEAEDAVDDMN